MSHNRDAAFHNPPYLFGYGYTAFKLNCLSASLLNKTGSILESIINTNVVGHEWHITNYHRLLGASNYGFGMV
ncbi:hypothetical protein ES703_47621 [subsurface metagenome]